MKTILVVDDFASVRFYHQSMLKQAGYNTLAARDGNEALTAIEQNPVDLVLLDLLMPKMNGAEFVQKLRGSTRFTTLPILVITAESGHPLALQLKDAPHLALLTKPLLPHTLLQEVRKYIG